MRPDTAHAAGGGKKPKWLKSALLGSLLVGVFVLGIGIGGGAVSFRAGPNNHNKNLPEDLEYATVEEVYDLLKADYDGKLDADKLLEGMKAGLTEAAGDSYTEYFSPEEAASFNADLKGTFIGIGAELGEDKDGNLIIVSPIDGFPADKAGLRPQDIIVSIDGKTTNDMSPSDAVKLIRGERDTKVTLRILRNKSEDLSFTLTRTEIKIPSVKSEMLEGKVGLIHITQFSDDTAQLTTEAATTLRAQGAQSILLDLRGNPGGLLDAAVDIADLWLPDGKVILAQKQAGVTVQTYVADNQNNMLQGVPTAVLINAGSASASEILAGALRDNKAATLYGEKSYGKGSVQEINPLGNGSEVKITIARWYRPNGQNIDKKGIKPDKEIKMTEDDYKAERDPQKDAAQSALRAQ